MQDNFSSDWRSAPILGRVMFILSMLFVIPIMVLTIIFATILRAVLGLRTR